MVERSPSGSRRSLSTQAEDSAPGWDAAPAETRYVRGRRRTSAEPLAAAWNLEAAAEDEAPRRGGLGALLAAYGWRIYAVPVLVALTALVVFDAARPGGGTAGAFGLAGGSPAVTEAPAGPVNLNIPTAELPGGGAFTQAGAGTWRILPGNGPRVGTGPKLFTYTVEIEDGINPAEYGGDDAFAHLVDQTLADPRSWVGQRTIALQRVDAGTPNPSFRVSLTTPNTDHRPDMCGFQITYETSCYNAGNRRVVINLARWVRGAMAFGGDLLTYRQYAINHEVGHAFGNGHVGCESDGGLAPVMMQQTFGVADNYVAQLNQVDPYNKKAVATDGKTCRPNAWPVPEAKPSG
ncbi:DUF3152 domain-containing protein [Gandjariella thermophila]|uniref:DUF3152 domain-containing protein n=1 Tax=Gandjariella thermophila TaxID=1931992 RepID=A0A4D4J4K4_9PSEU|nr:DUF3152 domain-containing protein [Gandjariella thermophila]GDY30040.1 hypothetical protein GTS_16730 [Gandjariella thermophila]